MICHHHWPTSLPADRAEGESTFMIVQQVEQQISQAWHFIYLQPMQKQPTREDLAGVVFFLKSSATLFIQMAL